MVIELTGNEAQVLIAALTLAEIAVEELEDVVTTQAIASLRPFRTRLVQTYLRAKALEKDMAVLWQAKV